MSITERIIAYIIQKLNEVGENFGWMIGKVGANWENGYMKCNKDSKDYFRSEKVRKDIEAIINDHGGEGGMMERLVTEIGLGFNVPKNTVEENGNVITCDDYCRMIEGDCTECPIQKVFDKLAAYEKLQEQGLLLKLPCKVGDKVYHVIEDNIANPPVYISEHEIKDVSSRAVYFADDWWTFEEMQGMNVFLSKEAAEQKLEELKNE